MARAIGSIGLAPGHGWRPVAPLPPFNERTSCMKIQTLAVHAGYSPDPTTKSAAVPLYQTVAYALTAPSTAPTCLT